MKEPIEPRDIRAGDLIRVEDRSEGDDAREYRANRHKQAMWGIADDISYFLLDRPKPVVVLPTEPMLGWVVCGDEKWQFGSWVKSSGTLFAMRQSDYSPDRVTAFTPATAVPTDALNALRLARNHHDDDMTYDFSNDAVEIVTDFLAAVDAANGVNE